MHCIQPCWHGSTGFGQADLWPPVLKLIPACPASSCVVNTVTWHNSPVKLLYRGNVEGLLDDILELKPHVFCSVPRLWNRIYDKVMGTIRESATSPTENQLQLLQTSVCRGIHPPLDFQLWARQQKHSAAAVHLERCKHMLSHLS